MNAWQLILLSYNLLPVPLPEVDHAETTPYVTEQLCKDEGKRQTDNQVIKAGTRRVAVCAPFDFPPLTPGL